jgi:hypothetical protein
VEDATVDELDVEDANEDGAEVATEDGSETAMEDGSEVANEDNHEAANNAHDVDKGPIIDDQSEQLILTDRHGRLIGDTDIPGVHFDKDDDNKIPGVDIVVEIPGVDTVELPGVDVTEDPAPQIVAIDDLDIATSDTPPVEVETVEQAEAPAAPIEPATVRNDIKLVQDTAEPVEPAPVAQPAEPQASCRSARIRTKTQAYEPSISGSRYSYAVTQLESQGVLNPDAHMFVQEDFYQAEPDVVATVMTQLSLKSGLKEWGDKAYIAAESEMKQLHFRNTFKPMNWKELTDTQRQTMLESHMFLNKKRDGKIKGRTVAGGNKQRDNISKEDASSPTVATESVLLSCFIDAEEERDVAVIDIPNAFVQTHVEDDDCKLSHRKSRVMADQMIEWLRHESETTRNYTVRGQVQITMIDYIEEIPTAFNKADPKGGGTKTSAASKNLFRMDEDCEKLQPNEAGVEFHNLVAKTLYATTRARPDTCTAIAFLMTRVRAPDKDDWTKVVHLMKYLRGTSTLALILLSANGSCILPLQGALFRKFRDQITGVIPARGPWPRKAKPRNGESNTHKVLARKGKTARKGLSSEKQDSKGLSQPGKARQEKGQAY